MLIAKIGAGLDFRGIEKKPCPLFSSPPVSYYAVRVVRYWKWKEHRYDTYQLIHIEKFVLYLFLRLDDDVTKPAFRDVAGKVTCG